MSDYDDIINLPYPVAGRHPRMSLQNRAAQFAPFAALAGHDEAIEETARLTQERPTLDESSAEQINEKLLHSRGEEVVLTCFLPDEKNSGGSCCRIYGKVKKLCEYEQKIILDDGREILLENLIDITIIS